MMSSSVRALALILLALTTGLGTVAPPTYAKKSKLTPAKLKQIKQTRQSYDKCRKDALTQLKRGALSQRRFEDALATCRESFPGAGLYTACKKAAVRLGTSGSMPQTVDQCRRYLTATEMDPNQPNPFFVDSEQLYFAGIGLNRDQPLSSLSPPNFDCERLRAAAQSPKRAQYLLFGNHPRTFTSLENRKGVALLQALRLKKPSSRGVDTASFGRVYGDPRRNKAVTYFPIGACDFDAEPGPIMAGLSAYYLMDAGTGNATPYFGIAYYRQNQSAVTTVDLVQSLRRTLGPQFKTIKKNKTVTFLTAAPIAERDEEKDPKNLCRKPRPHSMLAVVKAQNADPTRPEYAVVANVKNLCDFGDRLAKRLTE